MDLQESLEYYDETFKELLRWIPNTIKTADCEKKKKSAIYKERLRVFG